MFLVIALTIVFSIHFYLWVRLVRDTGVVGGWRLAATLGMVFMAILIPLSLIFRRSIHNPTIGRILVWPAMNWLGVVFIFMLLLLVVDVGRVVAFIAARFGGAVATDPERRQFMARVFGGAVAAVGTALTAFALREALSGLSVKEVKVALRRLPRSLDGLTIVQITDVHVGPTIGKDFVEEVVAKINALKPDVIAITGDLVDGSVDEIGAAVAPLANLKARFGVFFVTGNHEYYSGVTDWLPELARLGIRVLRNERVIIGEGDASFDLAGVDDWSSRGHAPGHDGPMLAQALEGRDPSRELVLLAHQPKQIHEAADLGVGLQLSGHTHGGQIWPWRYMVLLQQPYVAGLAKEKDTQLYVSCGTGYWGPPMRIGAPPEITRITLRAEG